MKIVISDYKDTLKRNLNYEIELLKKGLGEDTEIVIYEYKDNEKEFINIMQGADALITAYINITPEILKKIDSLKVISVNATGYNSIDTKSAAENSVAVCAINEYCTQEVADHALALILALNKNLKHYANEVENKRVWDYSSASGMYRLEGKVLGIMGLGKIGLAVAKRAMAFGIKVIGYDPYAMKNNIKFENIELVSVDYILENADIISLNMALTDENRNFLSWDKFVKMKKQPVIINVARGGLINEEDLIRALDEKIVRAAGLDVLSEENPDLNNCKLLGRENVIITPHSAFYSDTSMENLQRISVNNAVCFLRGEKDKVDKIVNQV